ncbi:MAG: hypothetical protein KAI70_01385 [Candidatus Omnitrophica bacterium]|nr:hypothetical protein [Candidatus Omnitrophota bacterium]
MIKNQEKIDALSVDAEEGKLYEKVISDTEDILIKKVLKLSFGNQTIAAKLLGINRNTLRTKICKLSIDVKGFKI